ncbi:uncharacterized protein VP01_974g3 [Puccinia sorghi]|uniref:Uncharacterized protein n=1 Tax=Puccinia sorghi TaxID=27349 RepID=A0A0L6U5V3_9BASI|nr:uncharacterized protein VP01_974g3 [Puccinia sorghi]
MTTADQTLLGLPFKYVSLISLTLQNSLLAILRMSLSLLTIILSSFPFFSYSNTFSRTIPNTKLYSASAAVLLNEILKCTISFLVALYNACNQSTTNHSLSQHSRLDHNDNRGSPFSRKPPVSMFEQDFQDWKRSSRSWSRMILDHSKQIFLEIIRLINNIFHLLKLT